MKQMQNKKGITPIIAVILLLMMTIAIGGLAYVWIQRLSSSVQSGTENTSTQFIGSSKVKLVVDGYNTTCSSTGSGSVWVRIYGRNSGTEPAKNVQLYTDDAFVSGSSNTTIAPGVATSWLIASSDACISWINKTRVIAISSDEVSGSHTFTFKCTSPLVASGGFVC